MKLDWRNNLLPYGKLSAGLFLALGLLLLWQSRRAPVGDFANYYYASRLWVEGQFSAEVYGPYAFNQMANRRSPELVFVNYTPVPPASVPAYLPFALIRDAGLARTAFSLLGLLLFCLAYCRLVRQLKLDGHWWLLLMPLICLSPLLNNFKQGQAYLLLLAFLMEGFGQWQKRRVLPAALLWAVPIAMKLFPAILLLFLLLEKDFRSFFFTMAFSAAFSLLPILFFPHDITERYFLHIVPRLFNGEINDPFSILYQSGRALLFKAFVKDQHLNPQPLANLPGLAFAGQLAYQAIVLASAVLLMQEKKVEAFSRFALAFLAGLLLTGYGSSYSMMLLLLPMLALPALINKGAVWVAAGWILIALAANIPVYLLHELPFALQFPRLYALLALLALLLWALRPALRPITIGFVSLLFIGKGMFGSPLFPTEAAYYLPDGRYGIIDGYEQKKEGLELRHFNGQGARLSLFVTQDSIRSLPELRIEKGQVFWEERQLSWSKSQKRQPVLLNGQYALYLSDEGRGVGFYTLRKMRIPDEAGGGKQEKK